MIYFRFLLSKCYPEICLFKSFPRLLTDARQNLETFEVETKKNVKQTKKQNSILKYSLCY